MKLKKLAENIIKHNIKEQNRNKKVIAYHGTPHGRFDKFSIKNRGTGADIESFGDYGKGFYFTPHKNDAINYAKKISDKRTDIKNNKPTLYTVELEMNKPFDMGILFDVNNEYSKLIKKYGVFNIPKNEFEKINNKFGITEEELNFYRDIESDISDNWGDWDIGEKISDYGFDSLINTDGDEYVVYSPSQIKILNIEDL